MCFAMMMMMALSRGGRRTKSDEFNTNAGCSIGTKKKKTFEDINHHAIREYYIQRFEKNVLLNKVRSSRVEETRLSIFY